MAGPPEPVEVDLQPRTGEDIRAVLLGPSSPLDCRCDAPHDLKPGTPVTIDGWDAEGLIIGPYITKRASSRDGARLAYFVIDPAKQGTRAPGEFVDHWRVHPQSKTIAA